MSNVFDGFGDASRLYARYEAVVDEMREKFQVDVAAFANALRDRVRELVREGKFAEEAAAANTKTRTWYVWDGTSDEEEVSHLWFRAQDASIVTPGTLQLFVATDKRNQARHQQVAELQSILKLPHHCRMLKGEAGSLFTVEISYGEGDPIAASVEPVLELLTRLYQVDQKTRSSPKKPRRA